MSDNIDKRVLVVKTSSMGDIIHALPALTDVRKIFPRICFDWVVEEKFAEIPAWHRSVEEVIPIALRRWRNQPLNAYKQGELQAFWKRLRKREYDLIIDAQGLLKSALVTSISRGIRCGLSWSSAREPLSSLIYHQRYRVDEQHAIMRIRQLFAKIFKYSVPNELSYGIDRSLFNVDGKKNNYVVFIHGTSHNKKCWPEYHWIELAKLINQVGYLVKIPWGNPEEKERALRIAHGRAQIEVLPQMRLAELASLLINAKATVAVDTGLGHLAAALSAPTVSLYGHTDPALIGTHGCSQVHVTPDSQGRAYILKNILPEMVWKNLQKFLKD